MPQKKRSSLSRRHKKGDKNTSRVPPEPNSDPSSLICSPPVLNDTDQSRINSELPTSAHEDYNQSEPSSLPDPYLPTASESVHVLKQKKFSSLELPDQDVMKPSVSPQDAIIDTKDMSDMSSLTSSYMKKKPDESDVSAAMETVARYVRSLPPTDSHLALQTDLKILNDKIKSIEKYSAMSSAVSTVCHDDTSESKKSSSSTRVKHKRKRDDVLSTMNTLFSSLDNVSDQSIVISKFLYEKKM